MDTSVGPVPGKERLVILDIIRGFALFGVLLVNMVMFNYTWLEIGRDQYSLARPDLLGGALERFVAWAIQLFFLGKFYTVFAFLFGLGFYLFLHAGSASQAGKEKLFRRRLVILLLAGLLHLVFVWWGDILSTYALIGFALLSYKEADFPRLRRAMIIFFAISLVIALAGAIAVVDTPSVVEDPARAIYAQGTYWEAVGYRIRAEVLPSLLNTIFALPRILSLFLLGAYVGKKGVFQNLTAYVPSVRRVWRLGGQAGVGLTTLYLAIESGAISFAAAPLVGVILASVLFEFSTILLSLFYVTSIMLLWQAGKLTPLLASLAPLGRMAFTNYLVQCVVCALLFYGHGLGLMNNISIVYIPLIALIIYVIQVVYSKWYLGKYSYGPAEYVWRRLTYKRSAGDGSFCS